MKRSLLAASACLILTCARQRPELAHAEAAKAKAAPAAAPAERSLPTAASAPAPSPPVKHGAMTLKAFFAALQQLGAGTRSQHVRVLWFGDSHTAADYLSGAVRTALAERFGDGGPGFVRIGTRPYRHDGLKIVREGNWNVDPDPPARRSLQGDGVFGLAGTRAVPAGGASFTVQVSPVVPGIGEETASFELSYMLPPGASFDVELSDKRLTVNAAASNDVATSGIAHLELSAPLRSQLTLLPRTGSPRLLNLVIERTSKAGVVVDATGIDGARLETPLAWNEDALVAEVSRRAPELLVVAYGTNEAFDALRVEKYKAQLAELMRRLRRGAPNASCLVLGPTDAPLGDGSVPRVAEVSAALEHGAAQQGCGYASLQQLMGGEGSFARGMKAKERLCQLDKLHLTPRGYQELGRALGKQLLDAYSAGRADL